MIYNGEKVEPLPLFVKQKKKKAAQRRKGASRTPKNAPFSIPDFIVTRGKPVGSVAEGLAPYRKYFSNRPAQWLAIEAAVKVAHKYPAFPKIIECWGLIPKADQLKVLALDYIVEAYGWNLREFIAIIKAVLSSEIIERASDIQIAALPGLVEASIRRAKKSTDPKETMAHLQRYDIIDKPKVGGGVTVQTQVNAPTQVNQIPSHSDFTKQLDDAVRAGRNDNGQFQLAPANLDNVIDAEIVTSPTVQANAMIDRVEMEQGPDYKQESAA